MTETARVYLPDAMLKALEKCKWESIGLNGCDDEAAHFYEKTTWREALVAIRDGSADPMARALAAAALSTEALTFDRHYS